jgi:hypothetical protein
LLSRDYGVACLVWFVLRGFCKVVDVLLAFSVPVLSTLLSTLVLESILSYCIYPMHCGLDLEECAISDLMNDKYDIKR